MNDLVFKISVVILTVLAVIFSGSLMPLWGLLLLF